MSDMTLYRRITSWRVQSALTALDHYRALPFAPFTALGLALVLGLPVPALAASAAAWLALVLGAALPIGSRLHDELDSAGVPCRWCHIDTEEDK
jgi:hypothetical protein